MNDSTIDWAHIINQALTVEKKDSIHYNQVSGKEMKAFFIDGDMRLVEVNGKCIGGVLSGRGEGQFADYDELFGRWTFENVLEGEKNGARSLCWKDYRYSLSFGPDSTR